VRYLSLASGAVVDAVVILAVVAANAVVGYFTESRVERILTTLQRAVVPQARVRRDDVEVLVPASALVPGDVIVLEPGHDVAADARMLAANGLAVDESALTGESMPVVKRPSTTCAPQAPLADRVNMVYAGTVVSEGSGVAVVTGTGRETEIGRIRALVAETAAPPTPLERQLDRVGRTLVGVAVGFCALTLGLGVLRGVPLLEMARIVISLAVAAIPEGLPAVATTTLALGMHRMMRRGMLVRRLAAVESLGATTVICADKTGTLTENRMTVHSWHVGGREYRGRDASAAATRDSVLKRAFAIGVLCNEAEIGDDPSGHLGSPTERALLMAAFEAGIDYRKERSRYRLAGFRHRGDGRNWMAAVHVDGFAQRFITVKGAPEQVLGRADRWLDDGIERPLTPSMKREIRRVNARMAARGLRVLGLAFRAMDGTSEPRYDGLVWVGLVALTDPVRTGVGAAIAACQRAGIRTVMITGDQAPTAAAVHRALGLGDGKPRVVEASRLEGLDDAALGRLARDSDVFARVSPAHKYQIVRALQAGGEIVAMTGDGINDAAALRAADIGVAMGARGTDVARDVADVVLLEDDFGAIVQAVEQGRTIHANIGKALRFLLSTNFSEILVTFGALALGVARPMSAIQFLWINLLSDVAPALALAVESPDPDVMGRPPRDPADPILSRGVLAAIAREAGMLAGATLGVHALALARHGAGPRATSVAFSTLTSTQLLHALRYRSHAGYGSALRRSPALVGIVGGSLALQALVMMVPPLRRLLGVAPLSAGDWGLVAGGAVAPHLIHELQQALVARRPLGH
jgi:Ca2+-transporting ATPase